MYLESISGNAELDVLAANVRQLNSQDIGLGQEGGAHVECIQDAGHLGAHFRWVQIVAAHALEVVGDVSGVVQEQPGERGKNVNVKWVGMQLYVYAKVFNWYSCFIR